MAIVKQTTLRRATPIAMGIVTVACCLAGCATATLTESGALSSYAGLKPSDGVLTKTKVRVDQRAVLAARSARLSPTIISDPATKSGLSAKQLQLVSNAIDRALCRNLSSRFVIVEPGQDSDIVIQAIISHVSATDTIAAGASVATNIGGTIASTVSGLPIPTVRIPLGMGSLSVEAEAKDQSGRQLAALVWARGADFLTTSARVAPEADAYTLASAFAAGLAELLVKGADPITARTPSLPSAQAVGEFFGKSPKYGPCKQFGAHPGLGDVLGGAIGLPPAWTDTGPK